MGLNLYSDEQHSTTDSEEGNAEGYVVSGLMIKLRKTCLDDHNHQPDVVHRQTPRNAAGVLSIMFHDLCRPLDFDPGPLSVLRRRVQYRTRLFLPEG
jgi:hypothetical protein